MNYSVVKLYYPLVSWTTVTQLWTILTFILRNANNLRCFLSRAARYNNVLASIIFQVFVFVRFSVASELILSQAAVKMFWSY